MTVHFHQRTVSIVYLVQKSLYTFEPIHRSQGCSFFLRPSSFHVTTHVEGDYKTEITWYRHLGL